LDGFSCIGRVQIIGVKKYYFVGNCSLNKSNPMATMNMYQNQNGTGIQRWFKFVFLEKLELWL
jgi:hypothetical protein